MDGHQQSHWSANTAEDPNGQSERRERGERRRSAAGLFEVRARREGIGGDRRRMRTGKVTRRRLRALWRRVRR